MANLVEQAPLSTTVIPSIWDSICLLTSALLAGMFLHPTADMEYVREDVVKVRRATGNIDQSRAADQLEPPAVEGDEGAARIAEADAHGPVVGAQHVLVHLPVEVRVRPVPPDPAALRPVDDGHVDQLEDGRHPLPGPPRVGGPPAGGDHPVPGDLVPGRPARGKGVVEGAEVHRRLEFEQGEVVEPRVVIRVIHLPRDIDGDPLLFHVVPVEHPNDHRYVCGGLVLDAVRRRHHPPRVEERPPAEEPVLGLRRPRLLGADQADLPPGLAPRRLHAVDYPGVQFNGNLRELSCQILQCSARVLKLSANFPHICTLNSKCTLNRSPVRSIVDPLHPVQAADAVGDAVDL